MKIAFIGYGIEAESAYHYYLKLYPDAEYIVYESQPHAKKRIPKNVVFYGNIANFFDIGADIVVRTPSVPPHMISTKGTVVSVTELFFAHCKKPIIGVTGTKGKGTTASLVAAMLQNANIPTWLVGNIGTPALDVLDEVNASTNGVVVYELSSFQLWDMKQSPQVAVVLTIEPEHLDVHGTLEDYVAAKANIAMYQQEGDTVIYFGNNDLSRRVAAHSAGEKLTYTGTILSDGQLVFEHSPLISATAIGLKGEHNLQNIEAALMAARRFTDDREALAKAIREFTGLPYRIEELGRRQGVLYVNDSFSSAPPATLAAVRAYKDPTLLIMGGYDRGLDLEPLVKELMNNEQLKGVFLIGQTGKKLKQLFEDRGYTNTFLCEELDVAFSEAQSQAIAGDVIMLSPGCASFDMFSDFRERGEVFRRLVATIRRDFVFEGYAFHSGTGQASFRYSFDRYDHFEETILFESAETYDRAALQKALKLAFILVGTSYYKLYPGSNVELNGLTLDEWQSQFFSTVYQEGMSQYAYENELTRQDLAQFIASGRSDDGASPYDGGGILALQSGGKDSLLTARLLERSHQDFDSFYVTSRGGYYPEFIERLPGKLYTAQRLIDLASIKRHVHSGALSGHVPVTFIVLATSLIQAVLLNKNTIVVSIGHEGEEPHEMIGDLIVTHQWSKTWEAEQLFANYVSRYISEDIQVGSPLRRFTELRIAELFVETSWERYGHLFSSCNVANYTQGNDNSSLTWCGECPKCANSYLLFAPFLPANELQSLFGGHDLFIKPGLRHTFEGLLGINGAMKPFECVGEIEELRYAYHLSLQRGGYAHLPFEVPQSSFDYKQHYPSQSWTASLFSI